MAKKFSPSATEIASEEQNENMCAQPAHCTAAVRMLRLLNKLRKGGFPELLQTPIILVLP